MATDDLRWMFGQDPVRYERARPGYPADLFNDLTTIVDIGPGSRVLEIGPGTGQATAAMIARGAHVVAVELASGPAGILRDKFDPAALDVVVSPFEGAHLPRHGFDTVVAFTSWHWLDPTVRALTVAQTLRRGGALVTVSTSHVAGGTVDFFAEMQACYERWDPSTPTGLRLQPADSLPAEVDEVDDSALFWPAVRHRYEQDIVYSTSSYLDVLMTYSGHRAMPVQARSGLLDCIGALIDHHYGGTITKRYLYEMRVAHTRGAH